MEHLQRVWLASRERWPSGHLVPSPIWDLLMLQLLRPNSSNLPCPYSTFHLEYPLVLSRFCFCIQKCQKASNFHQLVLMCYICISFPASMIEPANIEQFLSSGITHAMEAQYIYTPFLTNVAWTIQQHEELPHVQDIAGKRAADGGLVEYFWRSCTKGKIHNTGAVLMVSICWS